MDALTGQELRAAIRSRGYWQVTIRPAAFARLRIAEFAELLPIMMKTAVSLRGWNFPQLKGDEATRRGEDWIEQETAWQHYLEFWRFYQSGQFAHVAGMWNDWRDRSTLSPPYPGWTPGASLGVIDTVYRFTEIFEFAARLALTDAGDDWMHIDVTISNLAGRTLRMEEPARGSLTPYKTAMATFHYPGEPVEVARAELIAQPRELALVPAQQLFRRFGFNPSLPVLRDIQGGLRR